MDMEYGKPILVSGRFGVVERWDRIHNRGFGRWDIAEIVGRSGVYITRSFSGSREEAIEYVKQLAIEDGDWWKEPSKPKEENK